MMLPFESRSQVATDVDVLETLHAKGALRIAQLADQIGVEQETVIRSLDRLTLLGAVVLSGERGGWVLTETGERLARGMAQK